jgi:L-threonylcarbamoyladenylate synthase
LPDQNKSDQNKTVDVDSDNPESDIIKRAGKIIQNSGVVIFPAQCLYGVAVNALDEKAVKKVFNLKQRSLNNPILTLINNRSQLEDLVKSIPASAKKLMGAFWPGNLTIVFKAQNSIPDILTANTGKIGIRIPAHPVARALVRYIKVPITGTSANLSKQKNCNQADHLDPSIIENADLILDAGKLKGGTGSTIVDVTSSKNNIIRQGVISTSRINEILDKS